MTDEPDRPGPDQPAPAGGPAEATPGSPDVATDSNGVPDRRTTEERRRTKRRTKSQPVGDGTATPEERRESAERRRTQRRRGKKTTTGAVATDPASPTGAFAVTDPGVVAEIDVSTAAAQADAAVVQTEPADAEASRSAEAVAAAERLVEAEWQRIAAAEAAEAEAGRSAQAVVAAERLAEAEWQRIAAAEAAEAEAGRSTEAIAAAEAAEAEAGRSAETIAAAERLAAAEAKRIAAAAAAAEASRSAEVVAAAERLAAAEAKRIAAAVAEAERSSAAEAKRVTAAIAASEAARLAAAVAEAERTARPPRESDEVIELRPKIRIGTPPMTAATTSPAVAAPAAPAALPAAPAPAPTAAPAPAPTAAPAPAPPTAAPAPAPTAAPAPAPTAAPAPAPTAAPAPAPTAAPAPAPTAAPAPAPAPTAAPAPASASSSASPRPAPPTSPPTLLLGLGRDTVPPPVGPAATAPAPVDPADLDDADLDPIALATIALQRLRARARTDLASFRVQYQRLDGLVLVFASLVVFGAGFFHRQLVQPPLVGFEERGLRFKRTTAWLAPLPLPPIAPRLVRDPNPPKHDTEGPYHVAFTSSLDSDARLEVLIDEQPSWSNIVTGLELDRRTRWGELYAADESAVRSIAGHDWLRTAYRFAHAAEKGDEPGVGRAVEYAAVDREQIYIVTLFGAPDQIARMEAVVAPTLKVESRTGLPLVPQVGRLARRSFPAPVGSAFQSTVMVVVADLVDGRLRARGGGSGIIVGLSALRPDAGPGPDRPCGTPGNPPCPAGDGSILTNFHVLHDRDGRLHDVFVIGRFTGPDRPPTLVCAGRPSRSKLQRDVDLALIKCDTDLDGRAWTPSRWGLWPTIPTARLSAVEQGERLWVLGYPDVGGGGLTLSQGQVEGMTGEDGSNGTDYIKTNASITNGNSGGPVVDDNGHLIGIATAFRVKVTAAGGVVETAKVGLVRPLITASDLLAIATAGWTPREGRTTVELEPTAVDAPAEGIRISTHILDAANRAPVSGALLMVFRPGVTTTEIDMNRLDDLVLAWGRSNSQGEVHLKQPVPAPGTYSVMVQAKGFAPLIGDNALKLAADTPGFFDPWGEIAIESN